MYTGAQLLLQTIRQIENGTIQEMVQPSTADLPVLKSAPKIFNETCEINWNQPIDKIYNLIRGLSPYPTAFTYLDEKKLKIFSSEKEKTNESNEPGKILTDHKTFLKFCATDGYISLKEIQLEGKKRMNIQDFLRGYRGKI
jgi:methionyl-tRNA formyltransferase